LATRPNDLIYTVDEMPPIGRLIPLGFQFTIYVSITLVYIVLIASDGGIPAKITSNAISMGMITVGFAAMLQSVWKGPVGSGYFAPPVFSAVYLGPSVLAVKAGGLPAVFAMTVFAGLVEVMLGVFIRKLRPVFPPAVSGFIVLIIGIELGLVALYHFLDVKAFGKPGYLSNFLVAVLALAIIVSFSVWLKGIFRLLCSLFGVTIGFAVALFLGIVPEGSLEFFHKASVFALPDPGYISYSFNPALIPAFLTAGIAASLRTIGVITTAQKINDDDWRRPEMSSIRRGMFADGIGCILGGLLGAPGMNTTPGIVGLSKAAGATSRYIAIPTGLFLITFAFFPKISVVFLMLPLPVIGASLLVSASFMISGGVQIMTSRNLDSRMTYVIGISLILGIGRKVFSDYFQRFPEDLRLLTDTVLSLALISAVALNLIFRLGIKRTQVFVFDKTTKTSEPLRKYLKSHEKEWHLDDELIKHIDTSTESMVRHVEDVHLIDGPIEVEVSYDEVKVEIKMEYRGTVATVRNVGTLRKHFAQEEAFVSGLSDFLTDVYPDGIQTWSKGDRSEIRMQFDT